MPKLPSPPFAPIKLTGGSFEAAMHAAAELRREQEKRSAQVKRICDSWQRARVPESNFTRLLTQLISRALDLWRDDVEEITKAILHALDNRTVE